MSPIFCPAFYVCHHTVSSKHSYKESPWPILQRKKLRCSENKYLVCGHTAGKPNWDPKPVGLTDVFYWTSLEVTSKVRTAAGGRVLFFPHTLLYLEGVTTDWEWLNVLHPASSSGPINTTVGENCTFAWSTPALWSGANKDNGQKEHCVPQGSRTEDLPWQRVNPLSPGCSLDSFGVGETPFMI